jgi:hypothetical protein
MLRACPFRVPKRGDLPRSAPRQVRRAEFDITRSGTCRGPLESTLGSMLDKPQNPQSKSLDDEITNRSPPGSCR